MLIREFLPQLTHYNGVECDADLCQRLTEKISNVDNRNIQVNLGRGSIP